MNARKGTICGDQTITPPRLEYSGNQSFVERYLQTRGAVARPDWIPATVLFDEIRAMGYSGCLTTVRGYLRTLKPAAKADPVVRFETDPGQQMQVDWGSFSLNNKRISLFLRSGVRGQGQGSGQFYDIQTTHSIIYTS